MDSSIAQIVKRAAGTIWYCRFSNALYTYVCGQQAIFRAALLPHPAVTPKAFPASFAEFALKAAVPLAIFVAYHLVRSTCNIYVQLVCEGGAGQASVKC